MYFITRRQSLIIEIFEYKREKDIQNIFFKYYLIFNNFIFEQEERYD